MSKERPRVPRVNALVLIFNGDKVLLSKGNDSVRTIEFYRPFGGGVEFQETSLQAATREIREELGATLIKPKLLTVIENVFEYLGEPGHEITFLYSGELAEEEFITPTHIPRIDKENHYGEWIPLSLVRDNKVIVFPEGVVDYINPIKKYSL